MSIYRTNALPLSRLVPPPRRARRVAKTMLITALLSLLGAIVLPWQQSVSGTGRVIALTPFERQQTVDAPISGVVAHWHVHEGQWVEKGDLLVELSDNDPSKLDRLRQEQKALEDKIRAYDDAAAALEASAEAAMAARDGAVAAAEAEAMAAAEKIAASQEKLAASEATYEAAKLQHARVERLAAKGLNSERDMELAIMNEAKAAAAVREANAAVMVAKSDYASYQAKIIKARTDGDSKVEDTRAKERETLSKKADSEVSLAKLGVRLARQLNQEVFAPRDGSVFRILKNIQGQQVSTGDALLVLIPRAEQRAVELTIDGLDAAIVAEGMPVRIQFEGWPAVQFTGWPSVAVGTFGGRVAYLDAHGEYDGDFRMVVVPDPDDEPWPETIYLRQGVRANGWVLVNQVPLGYEVWRQLNGFPPSREEAPSGSLYDEIGKADKAKKKDDKGDKDDDGDKEK